MVKKLVTLGIAILLLFSMAALTACNPPKEDEDMGLKIGFEITDNNGKPIPDYPYFQIYSAYRFVKTKFDFDDVSVQLYYGHTLFCSDPAVQYYPGTDSDPRKNAESETKIVLTVADADTVVKEVDDFLSDEYEVEVTWIDMANHKKKLAFNHFETIAIPASTFENGLTHINGKFRIGHFDIGVLSEITDESLEEILINRNFDGETSRGYGGSGVIIYYCVNIEDGTVTIGKDETVYPKGLYPLSGGGYQEIT